MNVGGTEIPAHAAVSPRILWFLDGWTNQRMGVERVFVDADGIVRHVEVDKNGEPFQIAITEALQDQLATGEAQWLDE